MPIFITFDIFGTVLDWRTGMEASCTAAGRPLEEGEFDRIVDYQAELEAGGFLTYSEITRMSLVDIVGLPEEKAVLIGDNVGQWPLFADAPAIADLIKIAPCGALTNSDKRHGDQVQETLGFKLSEWLCAEEAGVYKPDPRFWRAMADRRGVEPGPDWWHVSAYADYDLSVAGELGLTTVFVDRPDSRPGSATIRVNSLFELADIAGRSAR